MTLIKLSYDPNSLSDECNCVEVTMTFEDRSKHWSILFTPSPFIT